MNEITQKRERERSVYLSVYLCLSPAVVDAFGKPSPAILDFNLIWLGAYDECRDVTVLPNMTSDGHGFSGQYCNAYIPLNLV